MPMIKVVADENIGFITALLAGQADVTTLPGRAIGPEHVAAADALIVRAVTPVDEALLGGSAVKFVGTTTSGHDHVDRSWLAGRGIDFAYAPGSNANAVAEFVTAALLELANRFSEPLEGQTIGIIGAGHIGSRMAAKATALGLRVLLNDPPQYDATRDGRFLPLKSVLDQSDIVTLHVPLTTIGPYPTQRMVDESFLGQMKKNAWLVNASRGPVVDETALKAALKGACLQAAVLDVWDTEPAPDPGLTALAAIATPHIAGYSYNGKIMAVRMVMEALAAKFGLDLNWNLLDEAQPDLTLELPEAAPGDSDDRLIHRLVSRGVYNIMADDAAFRQAMQSGDSASREARFDEMRKHYPRRYEFHTWRLCPASPASAVQSPLAKLTALGFRP